jgi:hypothetical protein
MLKNVFAKMVPFMRECVKILYSQTGIRWPYNMTNADWMLDT